MNRDDISIDRRRFIAEATAIGATLMWSGTVEGSPARWAERRDV